MENEKRENIEPVEVDIKGTIAKIVKTEEPELTQEEAIQKYSENSPKKKVSSGAEDDNENSEEAEHLNRIKKELLASLERVKQLAKKIYGEERLGNKEKLNVRGSVQKTKGRSITSDETKEEQKESIKIEDEKERE